MSLVGKTIIIGLITTTPVAAQTASATLSAHLHGLAKLSLSTNNLSFPDGDPDVFPQLEAPPVTITAKARAGAGAAITLTIQATDDLRSGVVTIPADALSWTATGSGFAGGTVSRDSPQLVGSWSGSGVRTGSQTFRFRNRWNYAAGTYSATLQYTLTSP